MLEHQPEPERWLPLRDACRLLHVNEATLRQWADNGYLRVYRTPGGHRRFWSGDVLSLTDDGAPAGIRGTDNGLEGSALRRIRRRLHGDTVARQPWYQSVEEEGRDRMRLFGRRLLSLLVQEPYPRRQRQEALAESHVLGKEYGSEMAERGVTLTNSLEAFVFFRSMVLESVEPKAWTRVLELADRVMVGLAESYQKHSS
jgi:excisionase family DNA binding protein